MGSDAVNLTSIQSRLAPLFAEATERHRALLASKATEHAEALAAGGSAAVTRSGLHVAAKRLAAEVVKWDQLIDWRELVRSASFPPMPGTEHVPASRSAPVRDAAVILVESAVWFARTGGDAAGEQLEAAAVMFAGKVRRATVEAEAAGAVAGSST